MEEGVDKLESHKGTSRSVIVMMKKNICDIMRVKYKLRPSLDDEKNISWEFSLNYNEFGTQLVKAMDGQLVVESGEQF